MKVWTCQRQTNGVKCKRRNPSRKKLCQACGKPRPVRRKPAHAVALEKTYEDYIVLNGGEHCGICGRGPASRKLDRDHDHNTGLPRGLLCHRCNRALPRWMTAQWLRAAASYLEASQKNLDT